MNVPNIALTVNPHDVTVLQNTRKGQAGPESYFASCSLRLRDGQLVIQVLLQLAYSDAVELKLPIGEKVCSTNSPI